MTLLDLYNILVEVGIPVSHYDVELENYPYIAYQELSTTYKYASGRAIREDIRVDVAHLTKQEFDPTLERLKAVLHKHKIGFTIFHVYDPDPKFKDIINRFELTIYRDLESETE